MNAATFVRNIDWIPARFMRVSDSQDIRDTLENIGRLDLKGRYGSLFIDCREAEIVEVWGCTMFAPRSHYMVEKVL